MKYYVVDAFAEKLFEGNPAGICVLEQWPSDELMQKIALENNLAETAFTIKENGCYRLRWFTPGGEIDLCGHATLAAAYILCHFYERQADVIVFQTQSGKLEVRRKGNLYELDFPAYSLTQVEVTEEMEQAIGARPVEAWMGRDLVCVMDSEERIRSAKPDQSKVRKLDGLLLHLTAKGSEYDCISRTFAPKMAVSEDAVCGSGHCHMIPLWAGKLGKNTLVARQASSRGGTLYCELCGGRVRMAGRAVLYSEAELYVEDRTCLKSPDLRGILERI